MKPITASADLVRSMICYEPETGLCRWIVRRRGKKIGDVITQKQIIIEGVVYTLTRLIWWPRGIYRRGKKFAVYVPTGGKQRYLGLVDHLHEAEKLVNEARLDLFGEFATFD